METSPVGNAAGSPRGLFRSREFRRLWAIGAATNAMRWVEMLAAALFTFETTQSGMAVAVVSALRTLPLLCFGAIMGVVCEAVSRKRILWGGLLLSGTASLCIVLLDAAGLARPWHIGMAAFLSGCVWATEMAVRRRMVSESAGPSMIQRAVALDSLTGAFSRMAGPLLGSVLYAWSGLDGAFATAALCYLGAALLVPGLQYSQRTRDLILARIPSELLESFAFALRQPTVLMVLAVTATMNVFAFSYVALVAPMARSVYGVSDALVGLLAAGEPLGGLIGGFLLARRTPRANPRHLMMAGSIGFLVTVLAMPLMPSYALACAILVLGGLGLALFSNMQTTLILSDVPEHLRSRQLGLVTVCIGLGPLGQLLIGGLAEGFSPSGAVIICATAGLTALAAILVLNRRSRPRG
ncbi:MFS transporter [Roseomonas sp. SSH11]|uniref:MFS transporter n=1 Tax=Pararoseomonas baculiformis TaxID=2820812 RepID=A0ABS4A9W2_9PROT|nr:MFS transporter [Pararoseomonas baculiformis]MBP0443796.1 MFS transporter [Pararoseomonas baculiformis]